MTSPVEAPDFATPARLEYRYRWRVLRWLLEGHDRLREIARRAWPRAVLREYVAIERVAEIPFAIRGLDLPRGSRVLDVGSRWSVLPLHLAALGYRTVALDLAEQPPEVRGPSLVRGDARRPPFRPESFDGATLISTVEHIGLGAYDPQKGGDDDLAVVAALRGLVVPGGLLIVTVPFGRPGIGRRQRVYDRARLDRLAQGWTRERTEFSVIRDNAWEPAGESEAAECDSLEVTRAVALLRLRRP